MDRVAQPRRPDLDRRRHQLLAAAFYRATISTDVQAASSKTTERRSPVVLNAHLDHGHPHAIEIAFNVAGTRIVSFMNDLSRVVAHRLRCGDRDPAVRAGQPTHDIGFLFTIAPAATTRRRWNNNSGSCQFGTGRRRRRVLALSSCSSRSGPTPATTPRPTSRRRRSAPRRVGLGRLPVGRRIGRRRLHRPGRPDNLPMTTPRPIVLGETASTTGGGVAVIHPRSTTSASSATCLLGRASRSR